MTDGWIDGRTDSQAIIKDYGSNSKPIDTINNGFVTSPLRCCKLMDKPSGGVGCNKYTYIWTYKEFSHYITYFEVVVFFSITTFRNN